MRNRAFVALVGDVVATLVAVAVPVAVVAAGVGGPIRAVLGGVLLLFLPGYALTTLLFPAERGVSPDRDVRSPMAGVASSGRAGLPLLERLAVGFGLSVALVPVFAWLLGTANAAAAFETTSVLVISAATAVLGTLFGAVRRARLPPSDRYVLPFGDVRRLRALWDVPNVDRALNVALTLSIVVAAVIVTAGIVAPNDGETFTQVSILTEADDGSLVTGDYPDRIAPGDSSELVLEVENYEQRRVAYTVVVQLQRVDDAGRVREQAELTQFSRTLRDGQTWQRPHEVSPTFEGENLRVAYLVYRGEVPEQPTLDSAYRSVTLWVDVTPSDGEGGGDE
ncbi:Uncharacterized membrane protein [Halogranum amylolyticum]|uniref:Uncharacterized membrane protein n=1 Tax=Halogranum amylolyticum TaxID=660520 RepID=A0A1H8MZU5_9EURY|nr:DUF1616 domain-containing protein [Halogranum amylolyticum]SEO22842.1 Uncharacterized membrane protein [Halogranum amylolyticum]